ncbi:hypothetical protein L204_100416 [Cryptococcus depauperatus]|nr:hypothetical protein L204_02102 [Cryptococcus depauperatus CBS 7855]
MSFLRRSTISKNKGEEKEDSPRGASHRLPRSRSVSDSSIVDDSIGEATRPRRRTLLGKKGRKKLYSLFSSSSSLSASLNDRESTVSPKTSRSKLHEASTPSGASTPSQFTAPASPILHHNGQAAETQNTLDKLQIGNGIITESPKSSPVTPMVQVPYANRNKRESLWSQWEIEDVAVSSSDEDDAFLTPDEGLSEVEEVEEVEDDAVAYSANPAAAVASPVSSVSSTFKIEPTNVKKGAVASNGDVGGTGRSTVHRTLPTTTEASVKRQVSHNRPPATTVDQAGVLAQDIEICRETLRLFLTSHMKEAEEYCQEKEGEGHHLYLQSAMGIIETLKGMMTFDSVDLHHALEIAKSTTVTASSLRRPPDSVIARLGGFVRSGSGLARLKAMTPLERHAELVYAEQSLIKSMLAIVSGGDWLGLIREVFNMRTAYGIYRSFQHFLVDADKDGYDDEIDMDFRSGVLLGTGISSLIVSLLPSKTIKIAEVLGYTGDGKVALATLMSAGGWSKDSETSTYDEKNEGLRRPVCDLILLAFHLVISVLIPTTGVDVPTARKILAYNLRRYPDGVFFLYFQARLYTTQCQPAEANKSLQRALDLKLEYIQLQHMCLWDYACNHLMLGNLKGAVDCFSILKDESNWSRAAYTYATAACLVELVEIGHYDASFEEANKLMLQLPTLTKKIAGKSLPIEKFAARKARKFQSQNSQLFLPAIELAYVFGAFNSTPRRNLLDTFLPRINKMLEKLNVGEEEYSGGYWDDYVLGHFLRGMCQFMARYQPTDAHQDTKVILDTDPPEDELDQNAEKDFKAVIRHIPDVQLDHWILFHCHYELGRLYTQRKDYTKAKQYFEVVVSGKLPVDNHYMAKTAGKYSLEGALMLKTHAALTGIKEFEK